MFPMSAPAAAPHIETAPAPASTAALRVLFVIPGEPVGSSMIFARRQAASLAAEGVEVSVFYLRSRTSPWKIAQEWIRFRRQLRRDDPQVVHAHFGTVTALFTAVAAFPKPLVITYRGSDLNPAPAPLPDRPRAAVARGLSQLAALRAGHIVCVSGELRARLWWRRDNVAILPSGVDRRIFFPEPRSAARSRLGWPPEDRVVLFNAGYHQRVKRLDLARAAVSAARRILPQTRIEIMNGETPPGNVPALMNAADCLLVTSDAEGSPTVVQEAMACNLPIISVDAGDTRERLKGVHGSRIVARDPEALGAALAAVMVQPERSDGESKVNEFCSQRIASDLRRIYERLAGKSAEKSQINQPPINQPQINQCQMDQSHMDQSHMDQS
jgi:glycosyltransferase involved in cell wall biosynthesis